MMQAPRHASKTATSSTYLFDDQKINASWVKLNQRALLAGPTVWEESREKAPKPVEDLGENM